MHTINIRTRDGEPKTYMMMFYMIGEDSIACYYGKYIDDISEYHKVVDEGFPKIQTIKGFIRFCGWLESGRPKTFKLKELEYIALHLNESERFATWGTVPGRSYTTTIGMASEKQIVILKNASKEQVEIRCRDGKDKVYLKPQQIIILLEGEVGRIIEGKEEKASTCAEKM